MGPRADAAAAAGHRGEPDRRPERSSSRRRSRDCNWIQGLEGDIDTSHLGFLHLGAVKPEDAKPGSFDYYPVARPRAAVRRRRDRVRHLLRRYRPAEADTYYWRIAHFLFPFYTMIPTGVLGCRSSCAPGCRWTTSTSCSGAWRCRARGEGRGADRGRDRAPETAASPPRPPRRRPSRRPRVPARHDGLARQVPPRPEPGERLPDRPRGAARRKSYTGIAGIHQQDQAITESMGPIYDRTQEHLGTSDAMVIRTRRRVIDAAKALRDTAVPPGRRQPEGLPLALRRRDPAARRGLARGDEGAASRGRRRCDALTPFPSRMRPHPHRRSEASRAPSHERLELGPHDSGVLALEHGPPGRSRSQLPR